MSLSPPRKTEQKTENEICLHLPRKAGRYKPVPFVSNRGQQWLMFYRPVYLTFQKKTDWRDLACHSTSRIRIDYTEVKFVKNLNAILMGVFSQNL